MDFFNIIKEVLSKPKEFFTKINKEQGIKNAFLYFLIFSVITTFLTLLYFYRVFSLTPIPQIQLTSGLILFIAIIMYIIILLFGILFMFIISGIIYLFVLFMKGRKGFYQTFKAIIYGNTPQYLFSIILSPIYILVYPKFAGVTQMSGEFLVWFIPIIILSLIVFIYTIYLQITGIKNLHKISTFRAFAAVFLLPFALVILIYLTFFLVALKLS